MIRAKNYGINVPQVFEIDSDNSLIVMKYIKGSKLRDILSNLIEDQKSNYFKEIGRIIAKLHLNGHIHGDITTSNLMITPDENIFLIDFGLSQYSDSIEDKSVDIHLFKRVLISSHGKDYTICFKSFLEGYRLEYENFDPTKCETVIKNMEVIATRGRYVKPEERL